MTLSRAAGNQTLTLVSGGRERSCLLYVPKGWNGATPLPLVLALHGATSNGRLMQLFCGLSDKADAEGFLVAYPNGTGSTPNVLIWNSGGGYGYAAKQNIDDVAFIRALLDRLSTEMPIDARRIYVAGMSNGAQMTYRLASELSDRIAAIAAVAGPQGNADPQPSRPMPVLHIHGTDDEFAPFQGGVGPRSLYGTHFRSALDTVRTWAGVNGCSETPRITVETPRSADGTRIIRHEYGSCRAGAEVVLFVVEGGGHTWPGRPPLPPKLGKSTANLDANDTIWEFFQRHPLPS